MFKVKKLRIDSNHDYVVMLLEEDAIKLGLHSGDRVRVCPSAGCFIDKKNFLVCELLIIDKVSSKELSGLKLKKGEIGIFESVFEKVEIKPNGRVSITPAIKPISVEYIKQKFEGKIKLKEEHFSQIILDIVLNRYTDIETTFFVLACSAHALDDNETIGLTKAMIKVGKSLNFKSIKNHNIVVDKHCIGGIPGNRTTMIVVPIVAAAGLTIPKTSSRAITSPAGTADTMEVLANVDISLTDMDRIVREIGACITWGGALDLSPADDIIINVEHPLEIDSEGQMIASILSKKVTAGSTHVLLDIPVGKTAKYSKFEGIRLKKRFEKIGKSVGLIVKVILSDGSQPIGRGIGPLLEAQDVLKVLKNDPDLPIRLKDKAIMMAGLVLEMGGTVKSGRGQNLAKEILELGLAHKKFEEIRDAQGRKELPKFAKYSYDVISTTAGEIDKIHNKQIASLAFMLGNPNDKSAGIYINKRLGEKVIKGETLFRIYSNSKTKLNYAKALVEEKNPFCLK